MDRPAQIRELLRYGFAQGLQRLIIFEAAAHEFHQPTGNRQSKAGAAILAGDRVIRLFERLEQVLPSLRHNTHSGVAYFEEQHYILVAFLDDPGSQDD